MNQKCSFYNIVHIFTKIQSRHDVDRGYDFITLTEHQLVGDVLNRSNAFSKPGLSNLAVNQCL